ncbi:hypothetical protein FACS1894189_5160 [Planctomycetales bacterium]|nr:hypothetical protein FACS1894189_5160 [Planctomycetales bacterium]
METTDGDAVDPIGENVGWTLRLIYRCAGIIGVNPDDFTLRQLLLMAEGRMSHNWDLFTPLICYVANPYMPKGKTLQFKDVHPFYKPTKGKKTTREQWNNLKGAIKGRK